MQKLKCDRGLLQYVGSLLLRRNFVTRSRNLYEVLGLTRAATATEVKSAYYQLSMMYHPDKNKNDLEAAEKFREITGAYEVLGNFRLRKLYDKGMIQNAGERFEHDNFRHEKTASEEDDPTTRFYKARMKKEHTTATGRTPIYDFDTWTNSHYGGEMRRAQRIKHNVQDREIRKEHSAGIARIEMVMLTLLCMFVVMGLFQKSYDVDRLDHKKKAEAKEQK